MPEDNTITSGYQISYNPLATNSRDSLVSQPPDALAVNDNDDTITPITLQEATEIHKQVKAWGEVFLPCDFPKKPSNEPFKLSGGADGIYTEFRDKDGTVHTHKEWTRPDRSVQGLARWSRPTSNGSERITEEHEYDFAPDGYGVGLTDAGFEILRRNQDGTVYKVPMKLGGSESPRSCTYKHDDLPTSADPSKNGKGWMRASHLPFIVSPRDMRDGLFFDTYNVSMGQCEPGALAAAYAPR